MSGANLFDGRAVHRGRAAAAITMPHPTKRSDSRRTAAACSAALLASIFDGGAEAQKSEPAPPDVVRIPTGLNLGQTSYFDAVVATTPGLSLNVYTSRQTLNEITGPGGRPAPGFNHPKIDVDVAVIQLIYVVHEFDRGCIGLNLLQPFVNFDSEFGTPGVVLRDNGRGRGDTTVGAFYQSKPALSVGRAVFYWRAEMDALTPFGSFNSGKDLDQGAGYASLNPYFSFSWLPTPRLEIGGRANYLYNFPTSKAPNPVSIRGLPFRNGQAGQAAWLNFDASFEVAPHFSLGANGYFLTQFTDDRFNGFNVPNSKEGEFYIGPGFHWAVSTNNILNVNHYIPISSSNLPQGQKINLQYIHPF